MNTVHYQAIVAAPGFALGVQCNADEITAIDFLEPRPEQVPETPLAVEAVRQRLLEKWLNIIKIS